MNAIMAIKTHDIDAICSPRHFEETIEAASST